MVASLMLEKILQNPAAIVRQFFAHRQRQK